MTTLNAKSPARSGRLLGIEIVRGVAVFAVVLSHSGDGTWGEMSKGVEYLRTFFSFHVPFFLAASFYFLSKKVKSEDASSYSITSLKRRIQRILVPYVIWSLIFLIIRCVFFIIDGDHERIIKIFDDPISILFLGGASYHLYFLPLLICGTVEFYIINKLIKDWTLFNSLLLSITGWILNFAISATGNQFQLGPNIAFENSFNMFGMAPDDSVLLRLISVSVAWSVTCLPYIGAAIALNCIDSANRSSLLSITHSKRYIFLALSILVFLLSTFLIDSSSGLRSFQKVTIAFSLLIASILFSKNIQAINRASLEYIAVSLGKCTLGIYLIHPVFIRTVRLVLSFLSPNTLQSVSVFSVLLISSVSFLVSWLVVYALSGNKFANRALA